MTSEERKRNRRKRRYEKRKKKNDFYSSIYDNINQVADTKHLLYAVKQSKKGVNFKASVQKYCANLLMNVFKAKRKILAGEDIRQGFTEFDIAERGKHRHIRAMKFFERVIQRCLCDFVLVPYLLRSLVYDNGASQKDKGIHFAINRCKKHIQNFYKKYGEDGWILQIDFSGYFDNVEHKHIKEIIDNKFKDEKLKLLIWRFIGAFGEKSLGIGSQVSQVFAVLYPSEIDHYIKEVLHIGESARYMDDSYIIHPDKEYLQNYVLPILLEKYEALGIKINKKKTVIRSTKDFKFLKVRFLRIDTGKILLKPNRKAFSIQRRKMRKFVDFLNKGEMTMDEIRASYQSFYGYYQHFDCKESLYKMDKYFYELFSEMPKHNKNKKRRTK